MGYPGGKGRLWRNIVAMMPPHDVYIETHLGGGAVLRNKRPSRLSIGIDLDQSVINAAAKWEVPGLALHQGDAVRFLEDYAFTGCELVYVDPPYMAHLKNGRRYYRYEYSDEEHVKLLSILCTLDCAVMISGYPSDTYEASLRGWRHVDLTNVTHAGLKKERIWANFDFSDDLHDYDPVGPDFRERERVRRKTDRWTKRLSAMPEIERRAVLAALIQAPEVEPSFIGRLLRQRLEAAR